VLEAAVRRAVESPYIGDELTLVWHAGEPLVLPIAWYEDAFARVERVAAGRTRIAHAIQTDGSRLSAQWCEFLKAHDVRVGVSYDGPAELHDRHRKHRDGRGTHAEIVRGMQLLRDAGIRFHIIAVITRDALERPDEMFFDFMGTGAYQIGFNFEESEGVNVNSSLGAEGVEARVRRFLERYLELSHEHPDAPRVREFDTMSGVLLARRTPRGGTQENEAFRILTVGHDGNFSTWSPELVDQTSARYPSFVLGNVLRDELRDVARAPAFRALDTEIRAGREACRRECPYYRVCGGGSPSNKVFENGTLASTTTRHCRVSRQILAEVVLAKLERSVSAAAAG